MKDVQKNTWAKLDAELQALNRAEQDSTHEFHSQMFTHVSDIKMQKVNWLIKDMIEQEALCMCFGAPGSGKTFCVLDMALCIASGINWHGKEVDAGPVIYIAGEGHAGFARRVAAWAKINDVTLDDVPFYKSNATVIMNDAANAVVLTDELRKLADHTGTPKMIVLDTLARTMAGDENSSEKIGEYVKACDVIKQEYGCTVLIVHHTGHANKGRARGSSSMYGALDAEFKVEPWGDNKLIIENTKMKDAEEPETMAFVKLPVELITPEGEPTSSLVLEYTPDKPLDKKDPEYVKQVVLEQIARLSDFNEVNRSELRDAVAIELEKSMRQANRDIKRLVDQGVLEAKDGMIICA